MAGFLSDAAGALRSAELAAAIVLQRLGTIRHYGGMQTVFDAAGGSDGLRRLADAWHRRVMADDVVAHAFSHGFHPQHVERLAAYWAEALGGPSTYSGSYGDETSVVKMHSGNGEHDEMDRRAIICFDQALADVGLAGDGRLRQVLHDYFAWATTTTMSRYHKSADDVPDGLSIPHWSWDGLQA
jgi:hemoglobin